MIYMKYDFDSIINRKNTNCLKWDLFDTELPMWVADMDFKVAPEISDEIIKYDIKSVNKELLKIYEEIELGINSERGISSYVSSR